MDFMLVVIIITFHSTDLKKKKTQFITAQWMMTT